MSDYMNGRQVVSLNICGLDCNINLLQLKPAALDGARTEQGETKLCPNVYKLSRTFLYNS